MENTKEQLEEVIRKNLTEKKEINDDSQTDNEVLYTDWLYDRGFNQAISQINTSLIADEVLKVVGEKIKEEVEKYEPAYESEDKAIVSFGKQLLSTLPPNKENKK